MSKRVADLLVAAPQAASVKNRYGIVGDTLNRIAHASDRGERARLGARDVANQRVACGWRKIGALYRIIAQTKRRCTTRSTSRRSSR
jgi:hypothetical protein